MCFGFKSVQYWFLIQDIFPIINSNKINNVKSVVDKDED